MAGLIELMVDRCADRGLVYCQEMSVLVLAWLSASERTGHRQSPSRAILPEVPEVPAGVEPTPGPGDPCGQGKPSGQSKPGGQGKPGGGQRFGHQVTLRLGDEIAGARSHRLGVEHAVEGITSRRRSPLPEPGAVGPVTPNRRDSRFFRDGRDAALGGEPRSACPYLDGRGGFQAAWLTGYDEASDSEHSPPEGGDSEHSLARASDSERNHDG